MRSPRYSGRLDGNGGGGNGREDAASAAALRRNAIGDDDRPDWWDSGTCHSINDSTAIVLGIGGRPAELLDVDRVRKDGVMSIRRFSGGGTVVVDHDCIWTTVIGRRQELVDQDYPRPIMEWSSQALFGPVFERLASLQRSRTSDNGRSSAEQATLVPDTKSCGMENSGRLVKVQKRAGASSSSSPRPTDAQASATPAAFPKFELRENDYVLGERKMAGNAQSIGRTGFLHHTSFLWDYQPENMEYLSLPSKRPEYRGDRNHGDFLLRLKDVYPDLKKADFFAALAETCEERFEVERVTLRDAMAVVEEHGGMTGWFENGSRTKVLRVL